MNIKKYIAWRTVHMVITLIIVLVLLFMLFRLMPGNAAQALIVKPGISEYEKNEILIRYGLSKRVNMPGDYFVGGYQAGSAGRYDVEVRVVDEKSGAIETVTTNFEVAADPTQDNNPPVISAVSVWQGLPTEPLFLNATVADDTNIGSVFAYVHSGTNHTSNLMYAPLLASNNYSLSLPGLVAGQYYANIAATDVMGNNATAIVSFAVGSPASGSTIYDMAMSEHIIGAGNQLSVSAEIVNPLATPTVEFVNPAGVSDSVDMTLVSGTLYSAQITPPTQGDYKVWVKAGGDYDAYQRLRVNTLSTTRPGPVDGPASGLDVTGLVTQGDTPGYPYLLNSKIARGGAVRITINLTAAPFDKVLVNTTITAPDGTVTEIVMVHPTKVIPRPIYEQFVYYMKNMLTFDFGNSFANNKPVWDEITSKIPATLWLFGNALILAYVLGIAIGMIIAWRRGSALELGTIVVTLFFYSMPIFWFALLSQWIFYTQLDWLPIGGMGGFDDLGNPYTGFAYIKDMLWHLILPLTTLTILGLAGDILLMRTSMLEVLGEDFVTTARAKGLKERTIMYKHAARNAMLPVVTSLAMAISGVISGGVLTETIFSWPGMGSLLIRATLTTDFPVVQGAFFILAILTIVGNMAADILYAYLDPRVQL
jgi:ABC-type dipeptide/oligopeptide/nickel transport system permease component